MLQDFFAVNIRWALWTSDPLYLEEFGRKGLDSMQRHMDELASLCRERDIPMTVCVYPHPDQIARRELDNLFVSTWREWSATRGASFIDLSPAFINDQESTREVLARYFITSDVHWNQAGHAKVAEFLLKQTPFRP